MKRQNQCNNKLNGASSLDSFGMLIRDRTYSSATYPYGFQSQEKDDEIKGEGNSNNFSMRMYDSRLGRFFCIDPLSVYYPWNSPYSFSENRVTDAVELEGGEKLEVSIN